MKLRILGVDDEDERDGVKEDERGDVEEGGEGDEDGDEDEDVTGYENFSGSLDDEKDVDVEYAYYY